MYIGLSKSISFELINSDYLTKSAELFPGKNWLEVLEESRNSLCHYHPILLKDKPFSPDDRFWVKVIKQVKFSIILFFSGPKIKKLFEIYRASNQFVNSKNREMKDLHETIDSYSNDIFLLQSHLELNRYLQENNNNNAQEIINITLDSYRTVLNARRFIWLEGNQITLNEDLREDLVNEKKQALERLKEIIENPLGMDFRQRNEELQKKLEDLFSKKTVLHQELDDIQYILNEPLDRQLRVIDSIIS